MEEEDCCPMGSREALPYGWQIVVSSKRRFTASYEYCTDSASKAPTRCDGEPAAKWRFYAQARRVIVVQGRDHFFVVADEAAYMHRDCGAPPK